MADQLMLFHDDHLAMIINDLHCYPAGLRFRLRLVTRGNDQQLDTALRAGHGFTAAQETSRLEQVLLTVTVPDRGSVETALLNDAHSPGGGLSLTMISGGGGGGQWDMEYWLTPLPSTTGDTTFEITQPDRDIRGLASLDNTIIISAAARAYDLWPRHGPGGS